MEAENDLSKKKKKKEENKKEKEYDTCVSDESKNPSTVSRTQAPLFLIFFHLVKINKLIFFNLNSSNFLMLKYIFFLIIILLCR